MNIFILDVLRSLKAYPPMTFRLSIGGSEPMEYRIVQKDLYSVAIQKMYICTCCELISEQRRGVFYAN